MKFAKLWFVLTLFFGFVFYLFEINYESYARDRDAVLTLRTVSAFELPGFWANKISLMLYVWWTDSNDHSMWEYPVRILLTILIASSAIVSGLLTSLCIRIMWPRF
jgi:hypothetical protein